MLPHRYYLAQKNLSRKEEDTVVQDKARKLCTLGLTQSSLDKRDSSSGWQIFLHIILEYSGNGQGFRDFNVREYHCYA